MHYRMGEKVKWLSATKEDYALGIPADGVGVVDSTLVCNGAMRYSVKFKYGAGWVYRSIDSDDLAGLPREGRTCYHEFVQKALFTSVYRACSKCGEEA